MSKHFDPSYSGLLSEFKFVSLIVKVKIAPCNIVMKKDVLGIQIQCHEKYFLLNC